MFVSRCAAALIFAVASGLCAPVSAQDAEAFYQQNKVVTITVGFGPGSGYDVRARLIARHLNRHIPGNPTIIVKNQPGAGSLVAANHLYNIAPKDGTTIGTFSRNLPSQALIGRKGVRFDPRQFGWIGSPEVSSRVCAVMADTGVRSLDDAREKQVMMGGMGPATAPSFVPRVLNELLGTKFNVVEGYNGAADINLAMQRGEVSGTCQSYSTIRDMDPDGLKSGKRIILFNMESKRNPKLPDVPSIFEHVDDREKRQVFQFMMAASELGYPYTAPPGLPKARLAALRKAFDDTMRDEVFVREAERQKLNVEGTTGSELSDLVNSLYEIPAPVVKKAQTLMGAGKG